MMLRRFINIALLGLPIASGFRDTSPLFIASSSSISFSPSPPSLIDSSSLQDLIAGQLKTCPSELYIIVSQPDFDFSDLATSTTPFLSKFLSPMSDNGIDLKLAASDVIGTVSTSRLSKVVESACGAVRINLDASTGSFTMPASSSGQVIIVDFPAIMATERRKERLLQNDAFLSSIIEYLPTKDFTLIYTTTPAVAGSSDKETNVDHSNDYAFQATLSNELKRDLDQLKSEQKVNITLPNGPLFERYEFFNPGLFMGLITTFLLLSIAYVAISGVSSLQITYAAFDKDMGPASVKNKAQ